MTAARATARRSSLPGQFWGCAMSGARSCLAVDIFLTCAVRVASAATGAPSPRRRQQARGRKVLRDGAAELPWCCLHFLSRRHTCAPHLLCPCHPATLQQRWKPTSQRRRGPSAGYIGVARLRSQGPPHQVTNCSNSEPAPLMHWHARGPASPPFPPLPPPAALPASTISDSDSQAGDLAYITPARRCRCEDTAEPAVA